MIKCTLCGRDVSGYGYGRNWWGLNLIPPYCCKKHLFIDLWWLFLLFSIFMLAFAFFSFGFFQELGAIETLFWFIFLLLPGIIGIIHSIWGLYHSLKWS
ncbi:MAG: hypothetical protein ACFFCZ_25690 [Promethearchaeota archaeon]